MSQELRSKETLGVLSNELFTLLENNALLFVKLELGGILYFAQKEMDKTHAFSELLSG